MHNIVFQFLKNALHVLIKHYHLLKIPLVSVFTGLLT